MGGGTLCQKGTYLCCVYKILKGLRLYLAEWFQGLNFLLCASANGTFSHNTRHWPEHTLVVDTPDATKGLDICCVQAQMALVTIASGISHNIHQLALPQVPLTKRRVCCAGADAASGRLAGRAAARKVACNRLAQCTQGRVRPGCRGVPALVTISGTRPDYCARYPPWIFLSKVPFRFISQVPALVTVTCIRRSCSLRCPP